MRAAVTLHPQDDDFGQAGTLVRDVMDDAQRDRLVATVVAHVGQVTVPVVRSRAVEYWRQVDADLGARVAAGLDALDAAQPAPTI